MTTVFPVLQTDSALRAEVTDVRRQLAASQKSPVPARKRLTNAAVVAAEFLLAAESVGDTARVVEWQQYINAELHDVGWRLGKWAERGNLRAVQALGVFRSQGIVLTLDREKACQEFKRAAEDLAASAWRYAQCLMESNPDQAWGVMERAGLLGHAGAQEWIARRCLGEFGASGRDFSCAREWLERSAKLGRVRSQTLLAYLKRGGHGGEADPVGAFSLYRLAAEQGDPDAQNNLGEMYEVGRGVGKDPPVALTWYLRAAEKGLPAAQFNAGRLLAIGVAGAADPAHARRWLVAAETQGLAQARQVLDWLDGGAITRANSGSGANLEAAPDDRSPSRN